MRAVPAAAIRHLRRPPVARFGRLPARALEAAAPNFNSDARPPARWQPFAAPAEVPPISLSSDTSESS
jgi:hypothetical protein